LGTCAGSLKAARRRVVHCSATSMAAVQLVPALDRATAAMRRHGVQVLLLGPGADLLALTGYRALPLERLTLLVLRDDGRGQLLVPALEQPAAAAATDVVPITAWGEADDPFAAVAAALAEVADGAEAAVGDQLWARFLLGIQAVRPDLRLRPASGVTRDVRMAKDATGLAGLRRAGAAIDRVHRRVPGLLRAGRTEAEVGRDIAAAMREEGHDDVDFVIVASGPNGASPHHETGRRRLAAGDGVVVDIGGPVDGWFSDCTRNYAVGRPTAEYAAAHEVLRQAQAAAVAAVRPGVTAGQVDAVARRALDAAGYGEAFLHRTGHGIGLEVHEEPYIAPGSDLVLEEGMTFSIEPGIYLPGRFGMRIEDIVAVTSDGVERLNTTATDLVSVDP
jgi:Xaa-Pro aminopeptidase